MSFFFLVDMSSRVETSKRSLSLQRLTLSSPPQRRPWRRRRGGGARGSARRIPVFFLFWGGRRRRKRGVEVEKTVAAAKKKSPTTSNAARLPRAFSAPSPLRAPSAAPGGRRRKAPRAPSPTRARRPRGRSAGLTSEFYKSPASYSFLFREEEESERERNTLKPRLRSCDESPVLSFSFSLPFSHLDIAREFRSHRGITAHSGEGGEGGKLLAGRRGTLSFSKDKGFCCSLFWREERLVSLLLSQLEVSSPGILV